MTNKKPNIPIGTSSPNFFMRIINYIHTHVLYLNNSKFFAGVIMIMLNIGSKFISVQFSKSTEEYLKYTLSKQILVFAMVWMATRDIYTSLGLTAVFIVLSDYLFNEESHYCIVPHKNRVLKKAMDINNDGVISESEINSAIAVLEKAKKAKQQKAQKEIFYKYYDYQNVNDQDNGDISLATQNNLPPINP